MDKIILYIETSGQTKQTCLSIYILGWIQAAPRKRHEFRKQSHALQLFSSQLLINWRCIMSLPLVVFPFCLGWPHSGSDLAILSSVPIILGSVSGWVWNYSCMSRFCKFWIRSDSLDLRASSYLQWTLQIHLSDRLAHHENNNLLQPSSCFRYKL